MTPDAHVNRLGFGLPAASICRGPSLSEPSREFQLLLGRPHPPAGAGQGWAVGWAGAAARRPLCHGTPGRPALFPGALDRPDKATMAISSRVPGLSRSDRMGQRRVIAHVPFSGPDPFPPTRPSAPGAQKALCYAPGSHSCPGSAEGRESCSGLERPFSLSRLACSLAQAWACERLSLGLYPGRSRGRLPLAGFLGRAPDQLDSLCSRSYPGAYEGTASSDRS